MKGVKIMTVSELTEKTGFQLAAGESGSSNEITGCYIGDLLSLAMARVEEGTAWVTIQTNINIVAVAALQDAACIIIADGFSPDDNTAAKANEEGIPILTTEKPAYDIAKALSALGI